MMAFFIVPRSSFLVRRARYGIVIWKSSIAVLPEVSVTVSRTV
jgi:hypothetical protein